MRNRLGGVAPPPLERKLAAVAQLLGVRMWTDRKAGEKEGWMRHITRKEAEFFAHPSMHPSFSLPFQVMDRIRRSLYNSGGDRQTFSSD